MSRPKSMPDDVKKSCLALVQGYSRRHKTASNLLELQRVQAVEYAAEQIRRDIPESARKKLTAAIFLNCQSGKKYPYKQLDIDGLSERGFYREREKFLLDIAKYMEMI